MLNTLETGRIELTPFDLNDVALLHQTFTNPFVRKYLWDDEIISIEQINKILRTNEQQFEKNKWGLWKILSKPDHVYLGFAGLWVFEDGKQPQLLYGLLPDKTGLGYATEAAGLIIHYAFHELQFKFLIAGIDVPNQKSREVCQRVNMKFMEEKQLNGKDAAFFIIENKNE